MSVPKYFEMQKPILNCLSDEKDHSMKDVYNAMIRIFQLTEDDISELLPSGKQTYLANRAGWARTYLKKAGLIEAPKRGVYRITSAGKKVLQDYPPVIDSQYLMQFESFREFASSTPKETAAPEEKENEETPEGELELAFQKINHSLADDLLNEVMKLSPKAFEKLVLDLMQKMGYGTFADAIKTTAYTGDEGIDGIIMEDKLGFDLIYVQAKHWAEDHPVGRPEVQAFVGAIAGKGGKGLFVTTSKFTRQAIDYAKGQHVILMDGEKLAYSMIEYDFGVSTRQIFAIKTLDSDLFNDYLEEA